LQKGHGRHITSLAHEERLSVEDGGVAIGEVTIVDKGGSEDPMRQVRK
jgi:hypothetical protein